ncbi:MAG: hypothetical protein HGA44_18425, partial [Cellulomonadaceae bacterium]|nr:hypothetical protein [Cellulomonadaceae bacterium]
AAAPGPTASEAAALLEAARVLSGAVNDVAVAWARLALKRDQAVYGQLAVLRTAAADLVARLDEAVPPTGDPPDPATDEPPPVEQYSAEWWRLAALVDHAADTDQDAELRKTVLDSATRAFTHHHPQERTA